MDDADDRDMDERMPVRGRAARAHAGREMGKFKRGTLRSGSKRGRRVRSRRQAVAIALNSARRKRRRGEL